MTTSVRYKFVKNATGAALTAANFPMQNDGDDKQFKCVKRVLVAADIGTGAGQTGHASGMILDVINSTTNVLWILGFVHGAKTAVGGMVPYYDLTGKTYPTAEPLTQVDARFGVGTDNIVRLIDGNAAVGTAALSAGDTVTVLIFIGSAQESSDVMNP